ncbi:MAG TPA: hypothetical protein VFG55_06765, partial [Rhodanobacteraceae bacterium]|nr:hypothetical protein [Rhodanobacteraceae bacterium]
LRPEFRVLLSRLKALLPLVALTMACGESTTPHRAESGLYILESVDGHPLPAIVSAGPAETSFILSATIMLDDAGNAVRSEHWRYTYQPNHTDEGTFVAHLQYRLSEDNITVGMFQPCGSAALCEGNKVGKLTPTTLTLAYEHDPTAPVFFYRRGPGL